MRRRRGQRGDLAGVLTVAPPPLAPSLLLHCVSDRHLEQVGGAKQRSACALTSCPPTSANPRPVAVEAGRPAGAERIWRRVIGLRDGGLEAGVVGGGWHLHKDGICQDLYSHPHLSVHASSRPPRYTHHTSAARSTPLPTTTTTTIYPTCHLQGLGKSSA